MVSSASFSSDSSIEGEEDTADRRPRNDQLDSSSGQGYRRKSHGSSGANPQRSRASLTSRTGSPRSSDSTINSDMDLTTVVGGIITRAPVGSQWRSRDSDGMSQDGHISSCANRGRIGSSRPTEAIRSEDPVEQRRGEISHLFAIIRQKN